jgi:hypothetical protein
MICPCLLQFGCCFRHRNDTVWRVAGTNEDPGSGAGKKADKHKTIHRKTPHVRSRMHEGILRDDQTAEILTRHNSRLKRTAAFLSRYAAIYHRLSFLICTSRICVSRNRPPGPSIRRSVLATDSFAAQSGLELRVHK